MESVKFGNLFISTFAALVLVVSPTAVLARSKPAASSVAVDREYVSALAGANTFLHAWQAQDHETSLLMLTDTAKRGVPEDRLQDYFSPGASVERSYEIGRGKKIDAGRFEFPVTLFDMTPELARMRPRLSRIVLIKTGKEEWAVDRLP
jgi:hypothetical protein